MRSVFAFPAEFIFCFRFYTSSFTGPGRESECNEEIETIDEQPDATDVTTNPASRLALEVTCPFLSSLILVSLYPPLSFYVRVCAIVLSLLFVCLFVCFVSGLVGVFCGIVLSFFFSALVCALSCPALSCLGRPTVCLFACVPAHLSSLSCIGSSAGCSSLSSLLPKYQVEKRQILFERIHSYSEREGGERYL